MEPERALEKVAGKGRRQRSPGAPQVPWETTGPGQMGAAVPLSAAFQPRAGFPAWDQPPQAVAGEPELEWVGAALRSAPERLGLLVRRKGSLPDRGGESASGSISNSLRHDPPILASPLGQVKDRLMFHVKQSPFGGHEGPSVLPNARYAS